MNYKYEVAHQFDFKTKDTSLATLNVQIITFVKPYSHNNIMESSSSAKVQTHLVSTFQSQ